MAQRGGSGWLSRLMGGTSVPTNYEPSAPYPDQAYARANAAGASYGMPWAAVAQGVAEKPYGGIPMSDLVRRGAVRSPKDILDIVNQRERRGGKISLSDADRETMRNMYAQGTLAAQRSALASLGLGNASWLTIDPGETDVNLSGVYREPDDSGYVNPSLDGPGETGSAIAHESMHRGIAQLLKDPRYSGAAKGASNKGEERTVRNLATRLSGSTTDRTKESVEKYNPDYKAALIDALSLPESKSALAEIGIKRDRDDPSKYAFTLPSKPHWRGAALEFLAAKKIASDKPGGPR